eukprot:TRINITY_DN18300_c0_g1_i2.p1 TRINITY_DN18300_c0_g1~~TRINITY_DN18300_c0_g1_i2.p1  ORF type:complete len:293 (+),score=109.39 TRINITY_DN18300_c0_g1_i2:69-947(+)
MIRRPPRSTLSSSSAASDVYKRQVSTQSTGVGRQAMATSTMEGCTSMPPVDSEGRVLRPPHEMIRAFFNRYDLDLSGTMNSTNELKQLTVNLIVNLHLETTVERIEEAVGGAGDMAVLQWDIPTFKDWFFTTFNFSEHEHIAELTKAATAINGEVEALQGKLMEAKEGSEEQKTLEAEMTAMSTTRKELAGKIREMNKLESEQKAKADAALEKKKLAEEARARKAEREAKAKEVAIAEGTAAATALNQQLEQLQMEMVECEDDAKSKEIAAKVKQLRTERAEIVARMKELSK